MTALDTYRALLIELDKYESPSFSIRDFNHFWNASTNEFVEENHEVGPDTIQSVHDDIQVLLSDPTQLNLGAGAVAPLPDSYRNVLHMDVTLRFLKDKGRYKSGDTEVVSPRKKRSSRKGYIEGNAYQKESSLRTWYRLQGNNIKIDHDPDVEVTRVDMEYLKEPAEVILNPDFRNLSIADQGLEANNPTIEFPDKTIRKIVRVCRRMFLENIESGRYNTIINENNLGK